MKTLIKTEELAMFLLSIFLFSFLEYEWWVYLVWILVPDIGMIGYAMNARVGAMSYNLFHHKGIAIIIGILGMRLGLQDLQLAGVILFGHASMDRILGYGLKFSEGFKHTHLGKL
ncbi:MAG: DUF4260 domain-containing protein [Ekhidna sp.]|nr:DUF4260 domain-containing protein [Ekhidna sp.]